MILQKVISFIGQKEGDEAEISSLLDLVHQKKDAYAASPLVIRKRKRLVEKD